jgi:hypothetical protein
MRAFAVDLPPGVTRVGELKKWVAAITIDERCRVPWWQRRPWWRWW